MIQDVWRSISEYLRWVKGRSRMAGKHKCDYPVVGRQSEGYNHDRASKIHEVLTERICS